MERGMSYGRGLGVLGVRLGVGSPLRNRPVPAAVTPGSLGLPPSDAIGQLCTLIALQDPLW